MDELSCGSIPSESTFERDYELRASDISMLQKLIPTAELTVLQEILPIVERNSRALASEHERSMIFWKALVNLQDMYKKLEEENQRLTSALEVPNYCQKRAEKIAKAAQYEAGADKDFGTLLYQRLKTQRRLDKKSFEADNVERRVLPSRGQDREKGVNKDISDKALSEVSQFIGQEWQQIAIESLNLKSYQLHEIKEDNPMFRDKVFAMFRMWKKINVGQASARVLFEKLNQREDVDTDALGTLENYL